MGMNATRDILKFRVAVSRAFEHSCYHELTIAARWHHASQTRNTSTGIRPSITAQKPNDDTTTIPRKKSADANMSAAVGRMRCPMIIPPFEKTLNEDDRRVCVNEPWMRHAAAAKAVGAGLTTVRLPFSRKREGKPAGRGEASKPRLASAVRSRNRAARRVRCRSRPSAGALRGCRSGPRATASILPGRDWAR
jgi:hypothetical protein